MTLLRQAVDWTMRRMGPPRAVAVRARASLDRAIAAIETTVWPGAVDYFSGLNADGFPVEFAFSSRDTAVRFTAEAAAPEVRAVERVDRAAALLDHAGVTIPGRFIDIVSGLQAASSLAWGAAIGGRHDVSGDRMKVYVEVPQSRGAEYLDPEIRGARMQQAPVQVMLGWESGAGRLERYFRTASLDPSELSRVLDAAGLGDRAGELLHAVAESWQGSASAALRERWGLSLAGPLGGPADVVSLFKEANLLFGGDARTRTRLLETVQTLHAGGFDDYSRVSEPLADSAGHGAHGILAFTVARGRPLELRIGLSPRAVIRAERVASRTAAA
jgi:hypothetical protein